MVRLAEHLKFDNMKNNPNCNPTAGVEWHGGDFMRKGKVGDWRNYFSQEMGEKFLLYRLFFKILKDNIYKGYGHKIQVGLHVKIILAWGQHTSLYKILS